MEKLTTIKAAAAAALGALTAVWGRAGWLAALWIAAMLLDYLTGTAAACKAGEWSSRVAREGLWHKTGSGAAVLTAALCDLAAGLLLAPEGGTSLQLFPLATAWYLLTELGSVAENAGKLGAPVPKFLLRAVQALRRQLDREEDDDT